MREPELYETFSMGRTAPLFLWHVPCLSSYNLQRIAEIRTQADVADVVGG